MTSRMWIQVKLVREQNTEGYGRRLNEPYKVAKFVVEELRLQDQPSEVFVACYLNGKNRVVGVKEIGRGNINSAPVDVRDVVRTALMTNAVGIILTHNHPSGFPEPSQEDIDATKSIERAAKLFGIAVLDHVIVGTDTNYVSLHERGIVSGGK